jgi:UDP-N-acetylmuramate: L-alanyl-gamma-D-glutamyl-meso-diaminopimelate ligase
MSDALKGQGIPYKEVFRPENIEPDTDLVIIGNAVSKTNPEVEAALARGIAYRSFPQALSDFFLADRYPVVVAGTHGKTTTSALMAWVLDRAGLSPGFLIGGWVKNFSGNSRPGKGKYFVVEGDEYDTAFFDKGPKFLHYRPKAAILTSIEFDHADIYADLAHVKKAFAAFVSLIPRDGRLLAADGDRNIEEVLARTACAVETYGLDSTADWQARALSFSAEGVSFEVRRGSKKFGVFRSPLAGRHNVMNALAVIALSAGLKVPADKIRAALASFLGVRRRQEVLGVAGGVTVIDDFAHHSTAIHETLLGLRQKYPGRRLFAVFEPRSATSRRNVFQEEFAGAFGEANRVIIADLFAPEKVPAEQRLDPKRVAADLVKRGVEASFCSSPEEILKTLLSELSAGDVVCIMSSGGFFGLHHRLLSALGPLESPAANA